MAQNALSAVWVWVAHEKGRILEASREALIVARRVADEAGGAVVMAVIFGQEDEQVLAELATYGADHVYVAPEPGGYAPLSISRRLAWAWDHVVPPPGVLFCPGTRMGREIGLRVGAFRGVGGVSDVVRVRWDDNGIVCDHLAFGGKVQCTVQGVEVVILRPDTYRVRPAPRPLRVSSLPEGEIPAPDVFLVEVRKADPRTVPLEQAEFIVAGGNGVRDFRLIWEFADLVGAAVGGSRVVCDDGRLERSRQIGESGTIVSPRCYIAVGISGAIQHVRGMQNSEIVITINTDRHAPIHDLASLAIIGDAHAVLQALIDEVRKERVAAVPPVGTP